MEQDRRGFLKSAGGAAFTTSLFPGKIRGANEKVNIAFIGLGRMGCRNLGFAGKTPGVHVAALCDMDRPALARAAAQAKTLGFTSVKSTQDFRETLSDPSIDAVCISTPVRWRAFLTVEACKAGKDAWVESPPCAYVEEGVEMTRAARQYRRVVQAGTVQRSSAFLQKVRAIVKSGGLGDVTFCRIWQSGADTPVDSAQFAFDEAMPLSISAHTLRYPGFVASYEQHESGNSEIAFHGAHATLIMNQDGYRLCSNRKSAPLVEVVSKELASPAVPHWANFVECLHTRRKPASDIETCVRSTVTGLLANISRRYSTTLDWDDKTFTMKPEPAISL
jgi:Oxidoreductase family, NAD-binding Rossmann fold